MLIREATSADWEAIWPIFHAIAKAADTYGYDPATSKDQAKQIWLDTPRKTYVCVIEGEVLGTYYLKTNHAGPGDHVCNCGYMVAAKARGLGLATSMCQHSQTVALALGYQAMQFNFVASSNKRAVRLWHRLGFETVGRLPKAFNHPTLGLVDALIMYRWLKDEANIHLGKG